MPKAGNIFNMEFFKYEEYYLRRGIFENREIVTEN